jgi:hypothetical protein
MENALAPAPVEVMIAGKVYRLSYPMRAAILYQRETARIERGRPRLPDPDPRCLCGARKSQHSGPSLIRVSPKDELLCAGFRAEDPTKGDSLFAFESWMKIDLNSDPERWLACLWCGMHERQTDGTVKSPLTLAELEDAIGLSGTVREINDRMLEAMQAWMPKKSPNATAPGEPAPADAAKTEMVNLPTSSASAPGPDVATDSVLVSS